MSARGRSTITLVSSCLLHMATSFNGRQVGISTGEESSSQLSDTQAVGMKYAQEETGHKTCYRDPFASELELYQLKQYSNPAVLFDKHHWAHEISHVEQGCVLLANEKLGGSFVRL